MRIARPHTDDVTARGETALGVSVSPLQAEALGLDPETALYDLLPLPFGVVRLPAHWSRMEPRPGRWLPQELDAQIEAAERHGKQIIVGVGAVKNFGDPEYFAPEHRLGRPLREGQLVTPATHRLLLDAALTQVTRVVQRYRDVSAIIAWQVEHEGLDPPGAAHSWRLGAGFVEEEVRAVRAADPRRSILMNGYLAVSPLARLRQRWRTRGQGHSFTMALRSADIVGVDLTPGDRPERRLQSLAAQARERSKRIIVTEGHAGPSSITPAHVADTYNRSMVALQRAGVSPEAYLFAGAEHWVLRARQKDRSYLDAFVDILERA